MLTPLALPPRGQIFNLVRAAPVDITEKSTRPVRQFITAGEAGEQVPDKSVFKIVFLDGIKGDADLNDDGYVTGSELGMHLQNSVVNYTRGGQHPQYGKINNPKLDKGDFVFVLAKSGGAVIEEPAPPERKATLRVRVNVSGARLYLDDVDRGLAPISIDDISPGRYKVKVVKDGYEPYEERVLVSAGKVLEVRAYLEKVVATGSIAISGKPEGAKVYLEGYYAGEIPCTLDQIEAGSHTIKVNMKGYRDWKERVIVSAGRSLSLTVNLKPTKARPGKRFTNSIGMKFMLISSGTFTMGSPSDEPGRYNDEKKHRVTLSKGFYIQTTEVTQGQWRSIMGSNPSHFKSCGDNCPAEQVSWNDCQDFIRRLNQKEGTNKYRLPTEAEWEYACRAESTTAFANGGITELKCAYDPNLDAMGWYCGNSGGKTHPVGQKKPNAWGLYDMHGNVWEWCQDRYEKNYPTGHVTDPKGPSSGTGRVLRGGSWDYSARYCRSALRGWGRPGYRAYMGFRVARAF